VLAGRCGEGRGLGERHARLPVSVGSYSDFQAGRLCLQHRDAWPQRFGPPRSRRVFHQVSGGFARPAGLEPATRCLEGSCSIRLSYGRPAHNCAWQRSHVGHRQVRCRSRPPDQIADRCERCDRLVRPRTCACGRQPSIPLSASIACPPGMPKLANGRRRAVTAGRGRPVPQTCGPLVPSAPGRPAQGPAQPLSLIPLVSSSPFRTILTEPFRRMF
jgi:hypothetical protein